MRKKCGHTIALIGLVFSMLILGGCGSLGGGAAGGKDGTGGIGSSRSETLLREGDVSVSENQHARFRGALHPGLVLIREDFSDREKLGAAFVFSEEEDGAENRYCRLSSRRYEEVLLADPDAPRDPDDIDERIADFRLRMRVRFRSDEEGALEITGRQDEHEASLVMTRLSYDGRRIGYELDEEEDGRTLSSTEDELPGELAGRWFEISAEYVGNRLELRIDGEEAAVHEEIERQTSGGIFLAYKGILDIDDIVLESLESPWALDEGESNGVEKSADNVRARALLIEQLSDDFSGSGILPWWKPIGTAWVPKNPEEKGLRLSAGDKFETVMGIQSRPLFSGRGTIELQLDPPPERGAAALFFGKPRLSDAYALQIARDQLMVTRYSRGPGKKLVHAPIEPGLWSDGEPQELTCYVDGSDLYIELNGSPLIHFGPENHGQAEFAGTLFVGYMGYIEEGVERIIRSVHIDDTLPSDLSGRTFPGPDSSITDNGGPSLASFPTPDEPIIDSFDAPMRIQKWTADANRGSSAEYRHIYDAEDKQGHLALDFSMQEGDGLHANVLRQLHADLSEYGGIAFKARAERIDRAHITLLEATRGEPEDRVDSYFSVGPDWREYRIPFTPSRFPISSHNILLGSDGRFDYSHVTELMFEIYGYKGKGSLYIDELRLLPKEASHRLSNRMIIEDFEHREGGTKLLQYQELYTDSEARGKFSVVSSEDYGKEGDERGSVLESARGSAAHGLIEARKPEWEYVDLRMDGNVPAEGYDGFGFSIRSGDLPTYRIEMHELEQDSSVFGRLEEEHLCRVPLTDRWVEWRFPFHAGAMNTLRYNPLQNGKPDGWIIQNISFLIPHHLAAENARILVDELHLFRDDRSRKLDIGLFLPDGGESPDPMISDIVHSVFDLNLRRVENYSVISGLEAENVEEAYERAAEENIDFFLRPVYEQRDDELTLELEVCNSSTRSVSNTITDRSIVGMNIFDDLDEVSEEAVNIIADTNLSFTEKLEGNEESETKVWRDELSSLEEYWIPFDRVTAKAQEGSGNGGIVLSPGDTDDTQWRREAEHSPDILKTGMILTDPYFEGIEEISFQVRLPDSRAGKEEPSALLLWNYRARDSYNSLKLEKRTVTVRINGYETEFTLPEDLWIRDGWSVVRLRLGENSEYTLFIGDSEIGKTSGPDLAFGRLGFGVENSPALFRKVEAAFRN